MTPDNEGEVLDHLYDIINGFSTYNDLYIKHFGFKDDIAFSNHYSKQMEELEELPTYDEQVKMLIEEGVWEAKKESRLKILEGKLKAAEITLPNILIKSQRLPVEKSIKEAREEINALELEKHEYIGITREEVANRRSSEYLIFLSVFKGSDLTEKYFGNNYEEFEDSLEEVPPEEWMELKGKVFHVRLSGMLEECKKLACSTYVQALVGCLPEEHEYELISRPLHQFTPSQLNLVQYASVFKRIFQKYDIPPELHDDPDKILEFPKQAEKLKEMKDKNLSSRELGSGKSYMGADHEEMKEIGMSGVDIFDVLEKSGKDSLGKKDLI